ncbi:MAG: Threonine synthase, partial [uncultured Nocardioides sp.]
DRHQRSVAWSDRGVPRAHRPAARVARAREPAGGRHAARALRVALLAHRWRGVAQGRGQQPDGLLQGPRDDDGDLAGEARGRPGGGVRVHRQHVGVDGRLRCQGRAQAAGAGAGGQDRRRQDGPGAGARSPDHHGARQLRPLPRRRPRAGARLPRGSRQLGQPRAAPGPEDRVVRGRRPAWGRPRLPPAPGRQRRQHLGLLARLPAVRRPRALHAAAGDARLPGRGCRAAGHRRALPRPRDARHRHPGRQPGVLAPRRAGRQGVRGAVRGGLRRADPLGAGRAGPARRRLRGACVGSRDRGDPGRAGGRGDVRRTDGRHHRDGPRPQG